MENTFKIERVHVKALDNILGLKFKVLDKGFIRVIDYMGSDESIVQAARVSYGKGTKKVSEDRGLIRYLIRNRHTTPFEMCELKLHVKVPMDTWRQWIRHRTANVNEYSTRYSIAIDDAQKTDSKYWRNQSKGNKQGSGEFLTKDIGAKLSDEEKIFHDKAREIYESRINRGVAREQARKDLPLSTYTEAYWKIDLHNLLHFLSLRMDLHAQTEIREYANIIGNEIVSKWCPITWSSFKDYRMENLTFSKIEIELLQLLVANNIEELRGIAITSGFLNKDGSPKRSRERDEFENKLLILGYKVPWKQVF